MVKTGFLDSPTLRVGSRIDFWKSFFDPRHPISALCARPRVGPEKWSWETQKSARWPYYPRFWALKTWYSDSPTPKMGGKFTLIAYKTTSSSTYAQKHDYYYFLTFWGFWGEKNVPGNLARTPRRGPVHPASLWVGGPGLFLWMPRPHKPIVGTKYRDSFQFWKGPNGLRYFLSTFLYTSLRFAGEGGHPSPDPSPRLSLQG